MLGCLSNTFLPALIKRCVCLFVLGAFILTSLVPPSHAQALFNLPQPGVQVPLSAAYDPAVLRGITIHPDNPLEFDFLVAQGTTDLDPGSRSVASRLIKYFLAALTVPEKDLWVNLSPYEKDRVVPETFGQTEMGRDLLAQDYMLKQLTGSVMIPEQALGKKFWDRVYQEAQEKFGMTDVPLDTFNKIWVVPAKAVLYEKGNNVFVIESRLKVMLDIDYLATSNNPMPTRGHVALQGYVSPSTLPTDQPLNAKATEGANGLPSTAELTTQIIREIILPAIEKEVNEGKTFASLRQIYNSVILATWFKNKILNTTRSPLPTRGHVASFANVSPSTLPSEVPLHVKAPQGSTPTSNTSLLSLYIDQQKIAGIDITDKTEKEKIYAQYVEAFKKGVYNLIKEEVDPATGETIPRKYFTGGNDFSQTSLVTTMQKMLTVDQAARILDEDVIRVNARLVDLGPGAKSSVVQDVVSDKAELTADDIIDALKTLSPDKQADVVKQLLRTHLNHKLLYEWENKEDPLAKYSRPDIEAFLKQKEDFPELNDSDIQKLQDILSKLLSADSGTTIFVTLQVLAGYYPLAKEWYDRMKTPFEQENKAKTEELDKDVPVFGEVFKRRLSAVMKGVHGTAIKNIMLVTEVDGIYRFAQRDGNPQNLQSLFDKVSLEADFSKRQKRELLRYNFWLFHDEGDPAHVPMLIVVPMSQANEKEQPRIIDNVRKKMVETREVGRKLLDEVIQLAFDSPQQRKDFLRDFEEYERSGQEREKRRIRDKMSKVQIFWFRKAKQNAEKGNGAFRSDYSGKYSVTPEMVKASLIRIVSGNDNAQVETLGSPVLVEGGSFERKLREMIGREGYPRIRNIIVMTRKHGPYLFVQHGDRNETDLLKVVDQVREDAKRDPDWNELAFWLMPYKQYPAAQEEKVLIILPSVQAGEEASIIPDVQEKLRVSYEYPRRQLEYALLGLFPTPQDRKSLLGYFSRKNEAAIKMNMRDINAWMQGHDRGPVPEEIVEHALLRLVKQDVVEAKNSWINVMNHNMVQGNVRVNGVGRDRAQANSPVGGKAHLDLVGDDLKGRGILANFDFERVDGYLLPVLGIDAEPRRLSDERAKPLALIIMDAYLVHADKMQKLFDEGADLLERNEEEKYTSEWQPRMKAAFDVWNTVTDRLFSLRPLIGYTDPESQKIFEGLSKDLKERFNVQRAYYMVGLSSDRFTFSSGWKEQDFVQIYLNEDPIGFHDSAIPENQLTLDKFLPGARTYLPQKVMAHDPVEFEVFLSRDVGISPLSSEEVLSIRNHVRAWLLQGGALFETHLNTKQPKLVASWLSRLHHSAAEVYWNPADYFLKDSETEQSNSLRRQAQFRRETLVKHEIFYDYFKDGQAPETVNVTQLVHERVELFRHDIEEKGLRLEFSGLEHPLFAANIDRYHFFLMLDNVMQNAVKYTALGGIRVSFERGYYKYPDRNQDIDDTIILKIADTGIGIPKNDLHTVSFVGGRASNVGDIPGTGNGIRFINDAARLMGIDTNIESEEGQGTTFTFLLNPTDIPADQSQDNSQLGGIDLNPALFDLQIKRDQGGVLLQMDLQPVKDMKIEGFLPVIINITPVTNMKTLLGLWD
jgi:hypothetical protein